MIAFEAVACARGGRLLFEGVSFALAGGEALLVRGANGTGKSSLLRLAAGLLAPAAGRITGDAPRGWMGELHALDPELPLARALALWATIDGARDRLSAAIAAAGLAAIADVPVRLLSTGQRRRAALVPLIAGAMPLWLLDEPASGLDIASVARLEGLIAAHRAGGGAVIIATHQPLDLPGAAVIDLDAAVPA